VAVAEVAGRQSAALLLVEQRPCGSIHDLSGILIVSGAPRWPLKGRRRRPKRACAFVASTARSSSIDRQEMDL
jgi:hypothetical protein